MPAHAARVGGRTGFRAALHVNAWELQASARRPSVPGVKRLSHISHVSHVSLTPFARAGVRAHVDVTWAWSGHNAA
jgi:hypothetical protein